MNDLGMPLLIALAAGAVVPGLRSVLLFDADGPTLRAAAATAAAMLRQVERRPVQVASLASAQAEDAIWGGLALRNRAGKPLVGWEPGIASGERGPGRPRLVITIPDLPRLPLAAQRACVAMIGAEEIALERHGHSDVWEPQIFWVATCARAEVGQLSAHLLDRFLLRISSSPRDPARRAQALREDLANMGRRQQTPRLPEPWPRRLAQARTASPVVGPAVAADALRYVPAGGEGQSMRRPLALTRLAFALAALGSAPELTPQHVAGAARLLGLRPEEAPPPAREPAPAAREQPAPDAVPAEGQPAPEEQPVATGASPPPLTPGVGTPLVAAELKPAEDEILLSETVVMGTAVLNPYPEDARRGEHPADALHTPGRRHHATASTAGPPIGVEPTSGSDDLALVSTIIEATKYQRVRRASLGADAPEGLILSMADLRRYRRAPVVEQLLLIVMDYTSLRGCDWPRTLMEHILWAYQERAAVTLVQVGAAGAANEYRAQLLTVDDVMVPILNSALNAEPGRATPLAHGLELALQTLRRATQSGRNAVQRARLVVLTDGRGNVALEDSQAGMARHSGGRRGVEDALAVAPALARLTHTRRVLLDPQPQYHRDLPRRLAAALDAQVVPLHRVDIKQGHA